jgi:hypothetical protein
MSEEEKDPSPQPERPTAPRRLRPNGPVSKWLPGPGSSADRDARLRDAFKLVITDMTPVFLSDEEREAFDREVEVWCRELRAANEPERAQVIRAVSCKWKIERGYRAETEAITENINGLEDRLAREQAAEVDRLIAQFPKKPFQAMLGLKGRSRGIKWVVGEVDRLLETLARARSLEDDQRIRAIHLMGRETENLFYDRLVRQFTVDWLSAAYGPGKIDAAMAARLLKKGRPKMPENEFVCMLEYLISELTPIEQGHAGLVQTLRELRQAYAGELERVEMREQRDLELKRITSQIDVSPAGRRLQRYIQDAEREQHRALDMLRALQKMRLRRSSRGEPPDPV